MKTNLTKKKSVIAGVIIAATTLLSSCFGTQMATSNYAASNYHAVVTKAESAPEGFCGFAASYAPQTKNGYTYWEETADGLVKVAEGGYINVVHKNARGTVTTNRIHFDLKGRKTSNIFDAPQILVPLNAKWGFVVDTTVVVPCKYDYAGDYNEGMVSVNIGGRDTAYLQKGFSEESISFDFKGGTYGYCNSIGKEVIPCIYDGAKKFSQGLAAVKSDGKWGYIDVAGTVIISFQYDEAESFTDEGFAKVTIDKETFTINKTGDKTTQ
jgi:hypothetical protein